MSVQSESTKKNVFLQSVSGALTALSITLVLILIFALLIRFTSIPDNTIMPINQAIKIISLFFGIFFALKKKGKTAVTVLAKKKGTARFQAIVGKTKRTCKVTIADTKADTKTDAGVNSDLPPVTADQPAAPIITSSPYINTKEPDPDPTPAATPAPTPVPVAVSVNAPEGADASDVEALKFLIKD